MIKTILVPGLNSTCSPSALQLGLQVARLFDGHIAYLHVHPDARELARYTTSLDAQSGLYSGQIWEAMVEGDKSCASRSRKIFDEFCAAEHLGAGAKSAVTAEWREVEGNDRDRTIHEAFYSDLLVFARPKLPDDLTSSSVGDVLIGCGRPLLLAPATHCANPLSTVVIAWKETPVTARAVSAALPLLAKAQTIHIVGIAEGDKDARQTIDATERLAEALRRHGLKPQAGHIPAGDRNACDVLLEAAEKLHGGVLVMGGYGHSRARELILGGFTRQVLHRAPLPVFICH